MIFPVSVSKTFYWYHSRSETPLYRGFEVRGRERAEKTKVKKQRYMEGKF